MGDKDGCGWTRSYAHVNISVNLCTKHLFARIDWDRGTAAAAAGMDAAMQLLPPAPDALGPLLQPPPPRRVRISEPARGEACPQAAAQVGAPWARDGRACLALPQ